MRWSSKAKEGDDGCERVAGGGLRVSLRRHLITSKSLF